MEKGKLIVVSGPSGVGKGTLVNEVLRRRNDVCVSISCTTRSPREGEIDGEHYFFKTNDEFERMIAEDGFLEYAQVFGNYYGSPRFYVEEKRNIGQTVVLEIDVQGAMQVRKNAPDATLVFIAPPSFEELKRRLYKRNTESEEQIAKRTAEAEREMSYQDKYDYIIVNDELEKATDRLLELL